MFGDLFLARRGERQESPGSQQSLRWIAPPQTFECRFSACDLGLQLNFFFDLSGEAVGVGL